ncbi:MAG: alpha-ketoacid dehydrogenase subunit beta [Chloroflexi bacterium]|nr:MAG: alpha-ketoacid dehydrogenase subunit beta [Chloroflexota bacterium]
MGRKTTVQALNEALHLMMEAHPEVYCLGEDIGKMGGDFGITRGLWSRFGADRVRDTPLSESAIIGAAVGSAMVGMRPVAEIMIADFTSTCYDQIVNNAAKMHYMFNGLFKAPIVIRTATGGGFGGGPHHSQSVEGWFMNVPGLVIVAPSNPYDAKGLLISSILDDNPVLFLEHKGLYALKGEVPDEQYSVPLGQAAVVREGRDITVIATMKMVHEALSAANTLAEEGIELEIIDLRTIRPWDQRTVFDSVRRIHRAIVVMEAPRIGGTASDISAAISEQLFSSLAAPVERIGALDAPIPMAPSLESALLPDRRDIISSARELMAYKDIREGIKV